MQATQLEKGSSVGFEDLMKSIALMPPTDLKRILDEINRMLFQRNQPPQVGDQDAQLEQQIRSIIPASIVRRYRQLHKKHQNESISEKEREEMLLLTDYMEEKSAERARLLGKLAEVRNVPIAILAKQFRFGA